jgi:hypothetical protein
VVPRYRSRAGTHERLQRPTSFLFRLFDFSTFRLFERRSPQATRQRRRSICLADENPLNGQLLLGTTQHRQALLHVEGNVNLIELSLNPPDLTVVGTQSIVEFLGEQVPPTER